jgi:hypothetical protein
MCQDTIHQLGVGRNDHWIWNGNVRSGLFQKGGGEVSDLEFAIAQLEEVIKELSMSKSEYATLCECEASEAEAVRRRVTILELKSIKNTLGRTGKNTELQV